MRNAYPIVLIAVALAVFAVPFLDAPTAIGGEEP